MARVKARQRSGSYVLDIYIDRPDGSRKRIRKSGFATVRERDAESARLRGIADVGVDVVGAMTFAQLGEAVIADKRATGKAPATLAAYKQAFAYANRVIGGLKLSQLTTSIPIDAVRDSMIAAGLAPKTTRTYLTQISCALGWAVKKRLMVRNVAEECEWPKEVRKPFFLPTHEQVRELIEIMGELSITPQASRGDPKYDVLAVVLATTGFRINEALNLRWDDVNLRARTLYITGGKTPKARRTISVGQETIDELLKLRDRQIIGGGFVFVYGDGSRIVDNHVINLFTSISERVGYRAHAHLLRHYHASTCLELGMDLFKLQARLGHESITTTIDTYGHLQPDNDREAAAGASGLLRRAQAR